MALYAFDTGTVQMWLQPDDEIEIEAGADIETVAKIVVEQILSTTREKVTFRFNGIPVTAISGDDVTKIVAKFFGSPERLAMIAEKKRRGL